MELNKVNCFVEMEIEKSSINNAQCKIELNNTGEVKHGRKILRGKVVVINNIYKITCMDKENEEVIFKNFDILESEILNLYLLKNQIV